MLASSPNHPPRPGLVAFACLLSLSLVTCQRTLSLPGGDDGDEEEQERRRSAVPFPVEQVAQALLTRTDLSVGDLTLYQTLNATQVTVSFRIANGGPATNTTFRTTIAGLGTTVNIDTKSIDGKPSIDAGKSLYFSKTLTAPATGNFTVTVSTDATLAISENSESNNSSSVTSNIVSPPTDQWVRIGPTRALYDFTNTGRLDAIVMAPGNPKVIYTHGERVNSGIWKTSDGGLTWSDVGASLPNVAAIELAVAPNNGNRLYAMTQADGLMRTDDGGVSWRRIAPVSMIAGYNLYAPFRINTATPNSMVFGKSEGIFRSTNGGYDWTPLTAPYFQKKAADGSFGRAFQLVYDPAAPDTLFASLISTDPAVAGVYRTKTAAAGPSSDWKRLGGCAGSALPPTTALISLAITNNATDGTDLYVLYHLGILPRLFKGHGTCNNGNDVPFTEIPITQPFPGAAFGFTVSPANHKIMFVGGFPGGSSFLYGSPDGGATWNLLPTGHPDLKTFEWDTTTSPPTLYAASDGGIHKSGDNGVTWKSVSTGVQNIEFFHLAAMDGPNSGTQAVLGGNQDNRTLLWDTSTTEWKDVSGMGDGGRVGTFGGTAFVVNQYPASLTKYENGTIVGFGQGLPDDSSCGQPDIHADDLFAHGMDVYVACHSLYYRGPDNAAGFVKIFTPPPGKGDVIRINRNRPSVGRVLYVGTTSGELFAANIDDSTSNLNLVWNDVFTAAGAISDIQPEARPHGEDGVLVTTANASGAGRVYRVVTQINGATGQGVVLKTAQDITTDLPNNHIIRAVAVPNLGQGANGEEIYVGTHAGLFRATSPDGGATWTWRQMLRGLGQIPEITGLVALKRPGSCPGAICYNNLALSTYGRAAFLVKTSLPAPPPPPTPVVATPGNGEVTVCFNMVNADTANLHRATTSGGPYTLVRSDVDATCITDSNRLNGKKLFYVVSGNNTGGRGANSVEVSATPTAAPPAPSDVSAVADDARVLVRWDSVPLALTYTVKRSTTNGGPYTNVKVGTPDTSFLDTGRSNGTTYFYVISATNADGESPNSVPVSATPQPTAWVGKDIGNVGAAGSFDLLNGIVRGAGADIGGTSDAFFFVSRPITGDCTVTAVLSPQHISDFTKAGLMMRNGTGTTATYVAVLNTFGSPLINNQYLHQSRATTGGGTTSATFTTDPDSWLRVVRRGNTFETLVSRDFSTWVRVGNLQTISSMPATLQVGAAVSSHVTGTTAKADLINLVITQP